ncbi:VCBS repeat-containing protein [Patescibacteria group bacterium]|nr:VCBS repeat-containing protein [Patescibacteria group bacterium]
MDIPLGSMLICTCIVLFIIIFLFAQPLKLKAEEYPRLANYYLKWSISEQEADQLAKWDFLILDIENQVNNPEIFSYLRKKNPKIKILTYVTSEEVTNSVWNKRQQYSKMRNKLYDGIQDSWFLKDSKNNNIAYWHYPDAWMLNMNTDWNGYLADFMNKEVMSSGLWDGVFYDVVFKKVSWVNNGDIDINSDGIKDDADTIDDYWQKGVIKLLKKTREEIGNEKIIFINGDSFDLYQPNINGHMFENFPTPWNGDGSWQENMKQYLEKTSKENLNQNIYILNVNTDNNKVTDKFREMRFGLSSALLGDGYFSFDFGDQDHSQLWWYDEYDIKLGNAKSSAYNLFDKGNGIIKPSVWRRDFSNEVSFVNSTDKEQKYSFYREEFEKINGTQDRRVNDGSKINYIKIASNDGVVLLKINTEIKNSSFKNGDFVRVFNSKGEQARNGFFSYNDNFSGGSQILISDIDNDKDFEILDNKKGVINVYKKGIKKTSFSPFGPLFKNEISFVVKDINNDGTNEIITAPAVGSPYIKIFSKDGKLLSPGWFAYDKNFRGGVSIAVEDINNDGNVEIITAPAVGTSYIKIFSKDGKLLNPGWFAYDKNFRGGVSIAVADLDNDGNKEIITAPASNGSSHIKIFSKDGKLIKQFFAFEKEFRNKIKVITDDINNDGKIEILISTESF